jgi:hypothetical protein
VARLWVSKPDVEHLLAAILAVSVNSYDIGKCHGTLLSDGMVSDLLVLDI